MTRHALFVDLPNFYSHLVESSLGEPRQLRDYFLEWFDFDHLAKRLTDEYSPVWVFYSGRRFGPKPNRIEGKYLDDFIERINSLKGVTAYDVNIPGQQREPAKYQCEKCGHEGIAQWESEKGIDASLTVRLFDTMDSWDVAHLLSGDADYVPAVASLRRRGKIVTGAGFDNPSSALIRECYEYVNLSDCFFSEDISAYQLCKPGGLLEKWLVDIKPSESASVDNMLRIRISWSQSDESPYAGTISLHSLGRYDIRDWQAAWRQMPKPRFEANGYSTGQGTEYTFWIKIPIIHWGKIRTMLESSIPKIPGIKHDKDNDLITEGPKVEQYSITYEYNHQLQRYDLYQD
jgi:hypothetical protein